MSDSFRWFSGIIYINLDHRKDRNKMLLEEVKRLGLEEHQIRRISAAHDILNGHRGCAYSHITALKFAREQRWKNVLILEDDIQFLENVREIQEDITAFFNQVHEWDVYLLAANVFNFEETSYDGIKRVLCAQCAHAYCVNHHYLDTVITCFEEAYAAMQDDLTFVESKYKAIDQSWKSLQVEGRWYIGKILGQQRRSYSDIEHQIRERIHKF